jgi:hypothetical protein
MQIVTRTLALFFALFSCSAAFAQTLRQNLQPSDSAGAAQCHQAGMQSVKINEWTRNILIDADNRPGGCWLYWSLVDAENSLAPLQIFVTYEYDGPDTGECASGRGRAEIPRSPNPQNSRSILIDTDNRQSACRLTFEVVGRNDIELHIQFHPSDSDVEQCKNRLPQGQYHVAKVGQPAWIGVNTHSGDGGCNFSMRIWKTSSGRTKSKAK